MNVETLTTELKRVYRELHYKTCGDLGYYVPITECPHTTCADARAFLGLPAGSLDARYRSGAIRPDSAQGAQ